MQQSPTISIEQESSPVTISHNLSENSLIKINRLEEWRRITKRIIQFFRFIKIPILRSRFIDMISHYSSDHFESEGPNGYETNKIQQDLLFLDDVKRYHEVFDTFLSFGFVWQDKEFQLAKLKAHYIHDHYMSTSEALAKTNIPIDTIPLIYNRINSPRIFPSLTYFNVFNDAEKFIIEKILVIYMRDGLNCFAVLPQKETIPIINRITNRSVSSFDHLKEINKTEKSISNRSSAKLKHTPIIEPQYDEIIIPNWTYSTSLGVVYNPIREKRIKVIKRNVQKKTKNDFDPNVNSTVKLSHNTQNDMKLSDSTFSKSVIPIAPTSVHHSSKFRPHRHPQISKHKSCFHQQYLQNEIRFTSSNYHRCDTIFDKNISDKRQHSQKVFICKVHSQPWPGSYRSLIKNEAPYRMAFKPQATHFSQEIQRFCH